MNITFTQVISTEFCIIYSKKQSHNQNKNKLLINLIFLIYTYNDY